MMKEISIKKMGGTKCVTVPKELADNEPVQEVANDQESMVMNEEVQVELKALAKKGSRK